MSTQCMQLCALVCMALMHSCFRPIQDTQEMSKFDPNMYARVRHIQVITVDLPSNKGGTPCSDLSNVQGNASVASVASFRCPAKIATFSALWDSSGTINKPEPGEGALGRSSEPSTSIFTACSCSAGCSSNRDSKVTSSDSRHLWEDDNVYIVFCIYVCHVYSMEAGTYRYAKNKHLTLWRLLISKRDISMMASFDGHDKHCPNSPTPWAAQGHSPHHHRLQRPASPTNATGNFETKRSFRWEYDKESCRAEATFMGCNCCTAWVHQNDSTSIYICVCVSI